LFNLPEERQDRSSVFLRAAPYRWNMFIDQTVAVIAVYNISNDVGRVKVLGVVFS
jgi:hypothetical protein